MLDATKSKFSSIQFQQINVDDPGSNDLKAKYGIRGIPHIVYLDGGGKLLGSTGAFGSVDDFAQEINSMH